MESVNCVKPAPNFKAKHLMKTSVLKKVMENSGKRLPEEAHFNEMSFSDHLDARAIDAIKHNWPRAEYTQMICSPSYSPDRKIYAITTQKENFAEADPDKILGIADFYLKEKNANLRFLQADPKIIRENDRSIIGVGKSLMQGIVEHLKKLGYETMDLYAEPRVKPFYEKTFPSIKNKESTMDSYTNMLLDIK